MKRFAVYGPFFLGLFLLAGVPGHAALAEDLADTFTVSAEESIDGNVIRAANEVSIAGAVSGDVVIFGRNVTVSGPVSGDVIVAASTVTITGSVAGSIRAIAKEVHINSDVSHNVWLLATVTKLGEQSRIGWDVYGTSDRTELSGQVDGSVFVEGKSISLKTTVGKHVDLVIAPGGTALVEEGTKVGGDLRYRAASENQLRIAEQVSIGGRTVHDQSGGTGRFWPRVAAIVHNVFRIIYYAGLLLLGLIFVLIAPQKARDLKDEMFSNPAASIGWGAVYFLVTPLAIILLALTIIGLPLAFITACLYVFALLISKVAAAFAVGMGIVQWASREKGYVGALFWPFLIGLVILILVGSFGVIGSFASLLIMLWSFGALMNMVVRSIKKIKH